jgi:hypothetical protein
MPFDKDSDWWPTVNNPERAVRAMRLGSASVTLSAALTAAISFVAISSGRPVFSVNGWRLTVAALLSIVAWRVYRLSLPWAIAGLALYTFDKLYLFANYPQFGFRLVAAVLFFPYYVNAVRGGLYLRRTRTKGPASNPPAEMKEAFEIETWSSRSPDVQRTPLPESTGEEYDEFLNCMKRGERKFQKVGFTIHDEYTAWLKDRRKKLALARAAEEKAKSTGPA